jgi:hypothetical protein
VQNPVCQASGLEALVSRALLLPLYRVKNFLLEWYKGSSAERKSLPTFRKPKMDDDIIAGMDIGMDIEL